MGTIKDVYGPLIPVIEKIVSSDPNYKNKDWVAVTNAYLALTSKEISAPPLLEFADFYSGLTSSKIKLLAASVEEYAKPNFNLMELYSLCDLSLYDLIDAVFARNMHMPINLPEKQAKLFTRLFNAF